MKVLNKVLLTVAISALSTTAANAAFVNGSFETGNLTGWTASQNVSVVSSAAGKTAVDGKYFGLLTTGLGTGVYSTILQSFSATAGSTLSLSAFFKAGDYMPFNDNGYAKLLDANNSLVTTLFSSNVATVGDYGSTNWTFASYLINTTGNYKIQLGVTNLGDNILNSYVGVDNVQLTSPNAVPVPAAVWLFGSGLAGLVASRRLAATA